MTRVVPVPGAVIDGFTLGEELHRGGMASIWSVTHPDHAGLLCMKMPLIMDGDEPGMIVSFEAEQMIMPRLKGPHVPRVYAVGDFADTPHIVMERLPGPSLEAMAETAPHPWEEVAEIGAEVATALASLHRQGVNHLDLKPANILRRPNRKVVLIDFGLSRHADLPDLLAEEANVPFGTGPYIAPEQVLGQRTDPRSDIFALGVILYRLATGVMPFGDPKNTRGMRERLWRDPKPPRLLNTSIPPWGQDLILRCLEVDASQRPATAAQLAYDLRHPDLLVLSPRAHRLAMDGPFTVWRRKMKAPKRPPPDPVRVSLGGDAPIIAVAVDLSAKQAALAAALQRTVGQVLSIEPHARLICLNVFRTSRIGVDQMVTDDGESLHVRRLVELREWARPLSVPPERLSHHVLESPDPAHAIVQFARMNRVDHLVMGARAASPFRRYLGSVSSEVVAEAPCSVTIVRLPHRDETDDADEPAVGAPTA
jgi:nucleotide-binding universal stress UspA family protein